MRLIEDGDIHRALVTAFDLTDEVGETARSHTFIDEHLRLTVHDPASNQMLATLLGELSYRGRETVRRVFNRKAEKLAAGRRLDLTAFWARMAEECLERRHRFFVRADRFEKWRRSYHGLDEDLPAIAWLVTSGRQGAPPDEVETYDRLRSWQTFVSGYDRQLSEEISKGIACQHLHLAGALPAPYFWVGLMNGRFRTDRLFRLEDPSRKNRYRHPQSLERVREHVARAVPLRFGLLRATRAALGGADAISADDRDLLERGLALEFDAAEQEELRRAIVEARNVVGADATDYAHSLHLPALNEDGAECPSLIGERMLIHLVLHELVREPHRLAAQADRLLLARAFWAYAQAKNAFLNVVQHREGVEGFDHFEYTLRMLSWLEDPVEAERSAVELGRFLQESRSVVKLELMTAAEESIDAYLPRLRVIQKVAAEMTRRLSPRLRQVHTEVRVGLVVHFIKRQGEELDARKDDVHAPTALRIFHAGMRDELAAKSAILQQLLRRASAPDRRADVLAAVPVVGIDAANRELHCPPEIFGATFQALGRFDNVHTESRRPLGRTFHVGEDFVHIVTGLRRIYESILFLGLRSGDRLGHCVALGTDPRIWLHAHPTVDMHLVDILDDAVFEWTILQEHGDADTGRLGELERRIAHCSMEIHGEPVDPHVLQAAWLRRGDDMLRGAPDFSSLDNIPSWVRLQGRVIAGDDASRPSEAPRCGAHNIAPTMSELASLARAYGIATDLTIPDWPRDAAERLLLEYLYDYHTITRSLRIETVPLGSEMNNIARLQAILGEMIVARGLTIESNPSSNWLIGGFQRQSDVPAVRWAAMETEFPFTINPDDPLTFHTSIENEYFFVFSNLLAGSAEGPGLPRTVVLERLRSIRLRSLETSFVE